MYLPGFPVFTNGAINSPAAIGDVDGDGQKEIAVANLTGPSNLYIIKANGTIMPGWPRAINPSLASNFTAYSYPVLGDLDGDGAMECVNRFATGIVHAFRSDGSYLPGWPQATKPVKVNTPAIGDIDGDGLPEVSRATIKFSKMDRIANYLYAWHAERDVLPNWPVKYDRPITISSFGLRTAGTGRPRSRRSRGYHRLERHHNGSPSAVNAYKSDGSKVAGFPKPTLDTGASSTNTIAVADLDGDGQLEAAWIDFYARLYVWDLSAPSNAVAPWPMFQHDERHTGAGLQTPEVIAPMAAVTSPGDGAMLRVMSTWLLKAATT